MAVRIVLEYLPPATKELPSLLQPQPFAPPDPRDLRPIRFSIPARRRMERCSSQDFQDYWNECRTMQERKDSMEEGELKYQKESDDGSYELEWLKDAGLDQVLANLEPGQEIPEGLVDEVLPDLSRYQANAVKRRVRTLNATQRRNKQRLKGRKPDIRDVFSQSELSSTGSRSRSGTPDSLDSMSPCRTPPSPVTFYPSGSPNSQGYHSSSRGSLDNLDRSRGSLDNLDLSPPRRKSDTSEVSPSSTESSAPSFLRVFSPPRTQELHEQVISVPRSKELRRQRSIDQWGYRPNKRGSSMFEVDSSDCDGIIADDSNVQIVRYNPIGTIYNPAFCPAFREMDADVCNRKNSEENRKNSVENRKPLRTDSEDGFEKHSSQINGDEDLPELTQKDDLLGITRVDYIGPQDIRRVQALALIELSAIFDDNNVTFTRRKQVKKKRKEGCQVFGVPICQLLARDSRPDCAVPLVLKKLVTYLYEQGLKEEGILRVPGHQQKIELLRAALENSFYSNNRAPVETAFNSCGCNDVVAVLKMYLRELPQPLLTNDYMDAFYKVDTVNDKYLQIRALNMLVLLLPAAHRDTLRYLLDFLADIIKQEEINKMSLQNVAMIMAPNFFLPKKSRQDKSASLSTEMNFAAVTCKVTKMLIKYRHILWSVPPHLVKNIRKQYEHDQYRRVLKENNKPMKKLLNKKNRDPIFRKINNEVDFQEGILRVTAPQFGLLNKPINLTNTTTAGDVVHRLLSEFVQHQDDRVFGRREMQQRRRGEDRLSCLLAAADRDRTLETHHLSEVGGNIGERRLEHSAHMISVYKENPNAEWTVRCRHRQHVRRRE